MGSQTTRDETQLLIGGKWVDAGDGTYDVINPATEEVVGQAPNASPRTPRLRRPRPGTHSRHGPPLRPRSDWPC